MNKKDILELRKRMKKDSACFTKICGCFVNNGKEKVTTFSHTFLNLEDEEFYKYLDIAKKTLSGTFKNNILELPVRAEEEEKGGRQASLITLRNSRLTNEEVTDQFFDEIIDNYDYAGSYLILLFHDAYDVIKKGLDGKSLDESEETYEYILCAICPVDLSKAGLGYIKSENEIGAVERDLIVGMPVNGFVFPAFSERSSDVHHVMYYTKNPEETHDELIEGVLGCEPVMTTAECLKAFENIINAAAGNEEDEELLFEDVQYALNDFILENEPDAEEESSMEITYDVMEQILLDAGLAEDEEVKPILKEYKNTFEDGGVTAYQLVDSKAVSRAEKRHAYLDLLQENAILKEENARLKEKLDEK